MIILVCQKSKSCFGSLYVTYKKKIWSSGLHLFTFILQLDPHSAFHVSCPIHIDSFQPTVVVFTKVHSWRLLPGFPLAPTLPPPELVAGVPRKLQSRSALPSPVQDFPSGYIFHSLLLWASVQVNLPKENHQRSTENHSKMQVQLLVSSFFSVLWMTSPSSCGQFWGGAFKPIGLNTIIRNRCLTEDWQGVLQQRGGEEGGAMAELVGEVAGPVTSRVVLATLHKARGHTRFITCSQRQLNKMERDFGSCVRKVQHQIRCKSTTPHERCTWVQAFIQTCTKEILGECLSEEVVESLAGRQRRYVRRHLVDKK